MTSIRHRASWGAIAIVCVMSAACGGPRDPATPEESAKRGDDLLRRMSDALKAAPAFSFTVVESHERLKRNGTKEPFSLKREVLVRRPDRLWSHITGTDSDNRNIRITYDGQTLTAIGETQKVYATIKAPATLDETLDLVSERYDLHVAVADFLYSSPYDSFADKEARGGWMRRLTVEGRSCEEVAYSLKAVDVTLSIASADPALPCEARIILKEEPGQPVSRLVFSDWNLKPEALDARFVASVPQGYELIPIIERIPKTELKSDPAKAMGAAATK